MCGIVGYVGKENCIPKIINGLELLEYRGYDSSGIAYVKDDSVCIKKECGKIENLKKTIDLSIDSNLGIGHTRWATHGMVNKINSHPHKSNKITLVHNGIIENYNELKCMLKDYEFVSDTDSEIVACLIDYLYKKEKDILKVLNKLKDYLIGSYALAIMVEGINKLYAIRKDSPLIIGVSEIGNFIASDVPAILKYTDKYYLLDNDEYVEMDEYDVDFYKDGCILKKELYVFDNGIDVNSKDGYSHYMLKEIYEQPKVILDTISDYLSIDKLNDLMKEIENYSEIDIIGCGSSYHVGMLGSYLISKYGDIRVNVDVASEYRYSKHIYSKKHLIILISQSGETADTLAVLRQAKENNIDTLAIVNVFGSSIARESSRVIYTKAGSEISVATTKAYTCQFMILSLIALYLGIKNNKLDKDILKQYKEIVNDINNILNDTSDLEEVAKLISDKKNIFYLGRSLDYSLCMEASLKLKEISYLHSEAYKAGELKHGTISLIDNNVPVISIITDDNIRLKTISNIKEVCARGALSIIISNKEILDKDIYDRLILVPNRLDLLQPILIIIKCQLLAYYVAYINGCDIDKPKNLAKSVTVE